MNSQQDLCTVRDPTAMFNTNSQSFVPYFSTTSDVGYETFDPENEYNLPAESFNSGKFLSA